MESPWELSVLFVPQLSQLLRKCKGKVKFYIGLSSKDLLKRQERQVLQQRTEQSMRQLKVKVHLMEGI